MSARGLTCSDLQKPEGLMKMSSTNLERRVVDGVAPTVEELIATVAFYGMAEIPADLLACVEEIAADLAEDDGTRWRVRSAFPYRTTRLAS